MNMLLKFTVNEPGSFFHILDSISLWDIHTRKEVRRYYEKIYKLSGKDKQLLKSYLKIRKRYPWRKLDSDFYPSKSFKEVCAKIKKRVNKKEYEKLNEIIINFYPNIHNIFLDWKKDLIKRQQALQKEITKHNLKNLFFDISKFYESKNYPKLVYVHLVINPSKHSSGGGANITPRKHITIEPRNLREKSENHILHDISVATHEILHLIEDKANINKRKKFMELVKKNKLDLSILGEAIADTLVSDGYLALKYKLVKKAEIMKFDKLRTKSEHKKSKKSEHYRKSRQKLSVMIYPLTKKQFDEGKSIFEGSYIRDCINMYVNMKKKTL